MTLNSKFCITIAALAAAVAVHPAMAQNYAVADLGSLSGDTFGYAINSLGQTVGSSAINSNGDSRAFRTTPNGSITAGSNLGTLGGTFTEAFGINTAGAVVGDGDIRGGADHAFLYLVGSPTDLGTLSGNANDSSLANGINTAGVIVGSSTTSTGATHAFRTLAYSTINGLTSDLGTLGGLSSIANGLNDLGQVVGNSDTTGGATHAFRTTAFGTITGVSDLGTLGGNYSSATAINLTGQVVGDSFIVTGQDHAFRTGPNGNITTASDLGTLGGATSGATAINTIGTVVGFSAVIGSQFNHAFVFTNTGGMLDLNTLMTSATGTGWTLIAAQGINDSGQIVGYGVHNGLTRAFLLTPAPEPSSLAVLILGIGATGMLAARKRRSADLG